jgi:hypothetical protein
MNYLGGYRYNVLGDDVLGDDMLGDDMLGDDMLGDDMLGDDMLGDDMLGDDMLGDDMLGDDVLGDDVLGLNYEGSILGDDVLGDMLGDDVMGRRRRRRKRLGFFARRRLRRQQALAARQQQQLAARQAQVRQATQQQVKAAIQRAGVAGGCQTARKGACGPRNAKFPLGFPPKTLGPGVSDVLAVQPQMRFQPYRLIIPQSIAGGIAVQDILIGQRSQLAASGDIPAEVFSALTTDSSMVFEMAEVSQNISIRVVNVSAAAITVRAALFGSACP